MDTVRFVIEVTTDPEATPPDAAAALLDSLVNGNVPSWVESIDSVEEE